jgi:pimeloyl-ACP methyl ester carboxylesterase
MMNKIQQHFGKNLPLATLFQGLTIEQLACILRQESNTNVWSPLVAIKPQGSKIPLFFIHSAGGTVFGYFDLAYLLNQEQPFYALQARGIDLEQEPHTQVKEMAAYYIQALQFVQPQGPYFLAGWSFGGLVAFEMAQQLLAQNQQISFLGMLDT